MSNPLAITPTRTPRFPSPKGTFENPELTGPASASGQRLPGPDLIASSFPALRLRKFLAHRKRQPLPPDSPTPLKSIPSPFPHRKYFDTQFHVPDHLRSAPPGQTAHLRAHLGYPHRTRFAFPCRVVFTVHPLRSWLSHSFSIETLPAHVNRGAASISACPTTLSGLMHTPCPKKAALRKTRHLPPIPPSLRTHRPVSPQTPAPQALPSAPPFPE